MSFYTYLIAISNDDTAQGDLARDIISDPNIQQHSIKYMRKYLRERCVSPNILFLFEETYINYRTSKISA
jgi:hypothetical protein